MRKFNTTAFTAKIEEIRAMEGAGQMVALEALERQLNPTISPSDSVDMRLSNLASMVETRLKYGLSPDRPKQP